MTVVRRDARRRWAIMAASVALLCALPVAVAAWPSKNVRLDPSELRELVQRSAGQPYEGYAESVGTLGLPELPRLGQVGVAAQRQHPDAGLVRRAGTGGASTSIDTGSERGVYYADGNVATWDYGANRITVTEAGPGRRVW